jgi:two-component system OmpR family response regulator
VRVLVVEDEKRMATLLSRGLVEDGYAVDVVGDGAEAVWAATEVSYDAVVLDLMLPAMDGFEVCRRLRAAGRWAPVLMLTARHDVADRIKGLDVGADDYLAKPFSFGELTARLRALLRRGAAERPAVLSVGDLRLDPAARQAWHGDAELELSPKEFAILELFMRNPGQVLSRARIVEHVWDFAYDGTSNVVDQYVGYLRRKVDRPFGVEQLETVRGAGYRLRAPAAALASRAAAGSTGRAGSGGGAGPAGVGGAAGTTGAAGPAD